jgi:hypothetical protein
VDERELPCEAWQHARHVLLLCATQWRDKQRGACRALQYGLAVPACTAQHTCEKARHLQLVDQKFIVAVAVAVVFV